MAVINIETEVMGMATNKAYASFEGSEITKQHEFEPEDVERLTPKKVYNYFVKYFLWTDATKKHLIKECRCYKKVEDLTTINKAMTDQMILTDVGSGEIERQSRGLFHF